MFGSLPIDPRQLLKELIQGLMEHDNGKTWTEAGNKVWTDAVKSSLKRIGGQQSASTKCYYTKAEPDMQEFLLDVVWWDKKEGIEGASLACECEWQYVRFTNSEAYAREVGADFGKLLVFKAPLKLMIFASSEDCPAGPILSEIERYLKSYKHHVAGEIYLVLDFVPVPKAWIARIEKSGAVRPSLSHFEIYPPRRIPPSSHAARLMATQYAAMSRTEKYRPSRTIPGSVARNASIPGEW